MSPQTQFSRLFLSLVLVSFINAYLFIFGCPRYSLFCLGFLHLVAARGGYSLVVVCGLLTEVAALAVAHRLRNCGSRAPERGLRSCSTRAQLLLSMWNTPGPQVEPGSCELAEDTPFHCAREGPSMLILLQEMYTWYFIQSSQQTYIVSVIFFFFHFTDVKTESLREEIAATELAGEVKIQSRV